MSIDKNLIQQSVETLEKDKSCAAVECDLRCESCKYSHDINESIDALDVAISIMKRGGSIREEKAREICAAAVETYGFEDQMLQAIEELSELQRAITRAIKAPADRDNLHEEVADVEIMLMQLRHIFDEDEIDDWKDSKLERLARMVGVEIGEEGADEQGAGA